MKKIIIGLVLMCAVSQIQAQNNPFPTVDSLIRFINKYIRNSAVDAFTNLRLNTALQGTVRFADSALRFSTRSVDSIYRVPGKDSIIFKINGIRYAIKDSAGGGAGLAAIYNAGPGFRLVKQGTDSVKTLAEGWGIKFDTSATNVITARADTVTGKLATQTMLEPKIDSARLTGFDVEMRHNGAFRKQFTLPNTYDSSLMASTKRLKDSIAAVNARIAAQKPIDFSNTDDVTGNLRVENHNSGTDAGSNTFWSGSGVFGSWKPVSVSTYFTVGTPGFPAAGATSYTNSSFADYNDYEVYRDTHRQGWSTTDGIQVVPTSGQIIFNPALTAGEVIHIVAVHRFTLRIPPFDFFDVNTMSNLRYWYDASNPTKVHTATGVDTLFDLSPNGYNLLQSTGGNQPAYVTSGGSNGLAYIDFTSGKSMAFNLPVQDSAAITLFMVIKQTVFTAGMRSWSFGDLNGEDGIIPKKYLNSPTWWGWEVYDGVGETYPNPNTGCGDWMVVRVLIRGGAVGGVFKNRLGGYNTFLQNLTTGSPTTLNNKFIRFNNGGAGAFKLSEVICIKGEPTTLEITNCTNYLMSKYNIQQRPVVLAWGDSHTLGTMPGAPAATGDTYMLAATEEKGYDLMNFAVSGSVAYPIGGSGGITGKNFNDLYTSGDPWLTENPYIVIQYGTNDGPSPSNSTWVTNYTAQIQHFITAGVPLNKIILCSPPYSTNPTYATNLATAEPIIHGIATSLGIRYCDFYNYTKDLGLDCYTVVSGDGIHGDAPIHRAMADKLKTFLP